MPKLWLLFVVLALHQMNIVGYAKLGKEVKCANGECTETISEGRAKLAYQPRDKKFLNLKKGDVVLVKGKKAGLKTDLWVGQDVQKNWNLFHHPFSDGKELPTFSTRDQKVILQRKKVEKETLELDPVSVRSENEPTVTVKPHEVVSENAHASKQNQPNLKTSQVVEIPKNDDANLVDSKIRIKDESSIKNADINPTVVVSDTVIGVPVANSLSEKNVGQDSTTLPQQPDHNTEIKDMDVASMTVEKNNIGKESPIVQDLVNDEDKSYASTKGLKDKTTSEQNFAFSVEPSASLKIPSNKILELTKASVRNSDQNVKKETRDLQLDQKILKQESDLSESTNLGNMDDISSDGDLPVVKVSSPDANEGQIAKTFNVTDEGFVDANQALKENKDHVKKDGDKITDEGTDQAAKPDDEQLDNESADQAVKEITFVNKNTIQARRENNVQVIGKGTDQTVKESPDQAAKKGDEQATKENTDQESKQDIHPSVKESADQILTKGTNQNGKSDMDQVTDKNTYQSVSKGTDQAGKEEYDQVVEENTNQVPKEDGDQVVDIDTNPTVNESTGEGRKQDDDQGVNEGTEQTVSESTDKAGEKEVDQDVNRGTDQALSEGIDKAGKEDNDQVVDKSIDRTVIESPHQFGKKDYDQAVKENTKQGAKEDGDQVVDKGTNQTVSESSGQIAKNDKEPSGLENTEQGAKEDSDQVVDKGTNQTVSESSGQIAKNDEEPSGLENTDQVAKEDDGQIVDKGSNQTVTEDSVQAVSEGKETDEKVDEGTSEVTEDGTGHVVGKGSGKGMNEVSDKVVDEGTQKGMDENTDQSRTQSSTLEKNQEQFIKEDHLSIEQLQETDLNPNQQDMLEKDGVFKNKIADASNGVLLETNAKQSNNEDAMVENHYIKEPIETLPIEWEGFHDKTNPEDDRKAKSNIVQGQTHEELLTSKHSETQLEVDLGLDQDDQKRHKSEKTATNLFSVDETGNVKVINSRTKAVENLSHIARTVLSEGSKSEKTVAKDKEDAAITIPNDLESVNSKLSFEIENKKFEDLRDDIKQLQSGLLKKLSSNDTSYVKKKEALSDISRQDFVPLHQELNDYAKSIQTLEEKIDSNPEAIQEEVQQVHERLVEKADDMPTDKAFVGDEIVTASQYDKDKSDLTFDGTYQEMEKNTDLVLEKGHDQFMKSKGDIVVWKGTDQVSEGSNDVGKKDIDKGLNENVGKVGKNEIDQVLKKDVVGSVVEQNIDDVTSSNKGAEEGTGFDSQDYNEGVGESSNEIVKSDINQVSKSSNEVEKKDTDKGLDESIGQFEKNETVKDVKEEDVGSGKEKNIDKVSESFDEGVEKDTSQEFRAYYGAMDEGFHSVVEEGTNQIFKSSSEIKKKDIDEGLDESVGQFGKNKIDQVVKRDDVGPIIEKNHNEVFSSNKVVKENIGSNSKDYNEGVEEGSNKVIKSGTDQVSKDSNEVEKKDTGKGLDESVGQDEKNETDQVDEEDEFFHQVEEINRGKVSESSNKGVAESSDKAAEKETSRVFEGNNIFEKKDAEKFLNESIDQFMKSLTNRFVEEDIGKAVEKSNYEVSESSYEGFGEGTGMDSKDCNEIEEENFDSGVQKGSDKIAKVIDESLKANSDRVALKKMFKKDGEEDSAKNIEEITKKSVEQDIHIGSKNVAGQISEDAKQNLDDSVLNDAKILHQQEGETQFLKSDQVETAGNSTKIQIPQEVEEIGDAVHKTVSSVMSNDVDEKDDENSQVKNYGSTLENDNSYLKKKLKEVEKELETVTSKNAMTFKKIDESSLTMRNEITDIVKAIKEMVLHASASSNFKPINDEARIIKGGFEKLEKKLIHFKQKSSSISNDLHNSNLDIKIQIDMLNSWVSMEKEVERQYQEAQHDSLGLQKEIYLLKDKIRDFKANDPFFTKHIAQTLQLEVEERTKMDERTLLATEQETKGMLQKLKQLEEDLKSSGFDNQDFINSLQKQAKKLKSKLTGLESKVINKKEQEKGFEINSKQKGIELSDRISILEAELGRRKANERTLYSTQYEAAVLKEKLSALNKEVKNVVDERDGLQKRFEVLEKEFFARKNSESETLKETQSTTQKLYQKIAYLEEKLGNVQNSDSELEAKEVAYLKEQVNSLEDGLRSKVVMINDMSSRSHLREEAFQKRINTLETELEQMSKREKENLDALHQTNGLMEQIKLLETNLVKEKQDKSRIGRKDEVLLSLQEKVKENEEFLKEMWSAMTKQKCSVKQSLPSKIHLQIEEAQSSNDNMEAPTQMQKNKETMLEHINDENNNESPDPTLTPPSDSYNRLHEGKIISWDESFDDKKKKETWDEEIGQMDTDSETTSVLIAKGKDKEVLAIKETDAENAVTVQPEKLLENETTIGTSEVDKSMSKADKEDEISPTAIESDDKVTVSSSTTISDSKGKEQITNLSDDNDEEILESGSAHEAIFDSSIEVEEDIDSKLAKLLFLVSKLPQDLLYIFTPLLELWVSLLPKEYCDGVLGVSWPAILLTAVLGVIICWILMWRSNAAKRLRKELAYDMNVEELRSQIVKMMKEKLGSENELEDLRVEMTKMNENSKKEKASSLHLAEELEIMKQKLDEINSNYNTSQEELKRASAENLALSNQIKDSEVVLVETRSHNANLQSSLSANKDMYDKAKQEEENLKTQLKSFEQRLSKKEEKQKKQEIELTKALKKLEDMNEMVRHLEDQLAAVGEEKVTANQETEVLKDCLLQFQGVRQLVGEDEELEGEEVVEKQKELMKNLTDVAEVRKLMKQTEMERERVQIELQAEKKAREESDAKYVELHAECEFRKGLQEKAERDAQVNQTKLNVVEEYYAKRDVEMQGKLGKEKTVREMKESELEAECGKKKELNEEVEMFKKRNRDQKKEFQELEKQLKKEIKDLEKKSHDNWIASRQFESKLDVANREVNQLRLEASDLHMQLTMKNRGMSPRPLPHNASFGPPPLSPSVRLGGRRSPTGSMHSEGHPDRPSHVVDGRPPHDFGASKPFETGDGLPHRPMGPRRGLNPSNASPHRPDFNPRGPPQGFPNDGPPPMYGPPPMNLSSFRPPMDAPGPDMYLNDMMDNSYSGRDRPPMIIDGPMRDRPASPRRDGPMRHSPFAPRPMPTRAERPLDNHPMVRPLGPFPLRPPSFPPLSHRKGGQQMGQPAPPFAVDDRRIYDQSRRSRPSSRQDQPPPLNNTIPMAQPTNGKQNPLMPLHGNDSCPAESGV